VELSPEKLWDEQAQYWKIGDKKQSYKAQAEKGKDRTVQGHYRL